MKRLPEKDIIMHFYNLMMTVDFAKLDEGRMKQLDAAVEHWRQFFINKSYGLVSMMTFTAEKMMTSNGKYTAVTPEDKMYFYIKMIDPQFYFLEAHEAGNTVDEIKQLCLQNFKLYDSMLIKQEMALHKVLKNVPEDMWDWGRIKR